MKQVITLGAVGIWLISGCGLGLRPRTGTDPLTEDGGAVVTPSEQTDPGNVISSSDAGPGGTSSVDPCPQGKVLCAGRCVETPLVPVECEPTWTEVKMTNSVYVTSSSPLVYDIERKELLLLKQSELRSFVEGEWKSKAIGGSGSGEQRGVYRSKRKVAFFFADNVASTWEWNGLSWARRADGPPLRASHSLVYDSERDRVVLFGGESASQTALLSDTWEWDGAMWTEVKSAAGALSARSDAAMAYDVARRKVTLFGGYTSRTMNDTWEFDGQTWTKRTPTRAPAARRNASMAYDPVRHRVVLFGGIDGGNVTFSDLWEWDGFEWTQRLPLDVPRGRHSANLVYDVHRQVFVLVGGTYTYYDMWELRFP